VPPVIRLAHRNAVPRTPDAQGGAERARTAREDPRNFERGPAAASFGLVGDFARRITHAFERPGNDRAPPRRRAPVHRPVAMSGPRRSLRRSRADFAPEFARRLSRARSPALHRSTGDVQQQAAHDRRSLVAKRTLGRAAPHHGSRALRTMFAPRPARVLFRRALGRTALIRDATDPLSPSGGSTRPSASLRPRCTPASRASARAPSHRSETFTPCDSLDSPS
jgi:hypothetical protein